MAFHVGILHLTGGYVGVDIFFVISGYLISSIIFSEIALSKFSIAGFYERRIRRIFPALFALLLAFSLFTFVFFLPLEMVSFAKTQLATTLSGSNFYLWMQSGYFDRRNSNPLLHTWSLAVEEQFYILFPIFLVLVRKIFPKHLLASITVLSIVSLISSAIVVARNPDTAFYMPYTRAWELLVGTLVALGVIPALRSFWLRNLVALAGLAMILYSTIAYTSTTPFPGLSALLPCLGSALIIGAGISGTSLVYTVLASRPLVAIGLISYSLYLWHWPVIMVYRMGIVDLSSWFERHFQGRFSPDRFDHIIELAVSFVLAYLSWKFVEVPFRKGRLKTLLPRRRLFACAVAIAAILVVFSSLTIGSGGFRNRFSADTMHAASYIGQDELKKDEAAQRLGTCFVDATTGAMSFNFNYCLQQRPDVKNYLLIGDSHAAAIWPALQELLPRANVMQVNVSSCPATHFGHPAPSLCEKVMYYIFDTYLPVHPVDALILESSWTEGILDALDDTLRWAAEHHVRVIVIGGVPEYDAPLARLVAYSIAWNRPDLPGRHMLTLQSDLEGRLRSLVADKWHFEFVSLNNTICSNGSCEHYADFPKRIPMMNDNEHLNRFGAELVVQRLVDEGQFQ